MRILTFHSPDGLRLGVATAGGVLDVAAAGGGGLPATPASGAAASGGELPATPAAGAAASGGELPATPAAFYAAGLAALPRLAELVNQAARRPSLWLDEATLTVGPAVPSPGKIVCVGRNYAEHAAESGSAVPETPMLFSKFNNALAGSGESVALPNTAVQFDYEAELAVVIGRRAQAVTEDEALSVVLGYSNANDLTARDLQRRTSQFLLGKSLDKFLPLGPYVVTADEVGDPQTLRIRCWVDGELRQDDTTASMVFSVRRLVSYVSQYFTLEPGDIICTGTPAGVMMGQANPAWLRPGQTVTVEVEGLGRLTTPLVAG